MTSKDEEDHGALHQRRLERAAVPRLPYPAGRPAARAAVLLQPSVLRELREGWQEFTKHAWVWGTVVEYLLANACWYGGLLVLGPVVAKEHLGGPAAWGWLNAAFSVGLILGGMVALRWMPKRPMLWVTTLAIPLGALAAGPVAAHLGVPGAEYLGAAVIIGAALLTLLLKDVWTMRLGDAPDWDAEKSVPPYALARD